MTDEQYQAMSPQSSTCWQRCQTKFSCNGDCPYKDERKVIMEEKQLRIFTEETQLDDECGARIRWSNQMSEEDIDHIEQWYKMQLKKIRRISLSSKTESS